MIFVFKSKTRARSETNHYKSLWIALLIGFHNKNRTFEFRIQTRARSETNNYKSLWIALLIGFHNKNRTFEFRIQTRARSETNNYKSLWIALLIGFQIRIELLNLESKPERDLKQIIIKVFGSCSRSVST